MSDTVEASAQQLDFFDPLKVYLTTFEGPLELLLDLIRKRKMDIREISLAEICEPYLKYLEFLSDLNLEVAGQFLSIASTLILIKSKSLLPSLKEETEEEGEEIDPEEALRQKLIEYQLFKEKAAEFSQRNLLGRDLFNRPELDFMDNVEAPPPVLEDLSIYSLLKAYHNTLKKIRVRKPHQVSKDENPIEKKMISLMELFMRGEFFLFRNLLPLNYKTTEVVITFMAILELAKMKLLHLHQMQEFGPIHCKPKPGIGEHLEQFREQLLKVS